MVLRWMCTALAWLSTAEGSSIMEEQQAADAVAGVKAWAEASSRNPTAEWRLHELRQLIRFLDEQGAKLADAVAQDLGKPEFECQLSELFFVRNEADFAVRHLKKWMKPRRPRVPLFNQPGRSEILRRAHGAVLILGTWNYPVQMVLAPLVGALAGGNGAVLKPSELAPATAAVLAETIPDFLDPVAIRVVPGGVETAKALIDAGPDHIFFTGGTAVGRKVMAAAAKNLVPLTVELGGK